MSFRKPYTMSLKCSNTWANDSQDVTVPSWLTLFFVYESEYGALL
jgi:hypothetical protein